MLSMILVLSILEHMIPPIPFLPPNVKLGLSNIITMYCFFFVGKKYALILAILKSVFVFLIRGALASSLSLVGGVLSILVIALLVFLFRTKISYTLISIAGAIAHNLGQIVVASFVLGSDMVFFYMPVLLISGVVMGSITGTLLKVVMPVFKNILKM